MDGAARKLPKVEGRCHRPPLPLLSGVTLLAGLLTCLSCAEVSQRMFLGARDREISEATEAIQSARDDGRRAKALSSRGIAYSEKARYSRSFKLIPDAEYEKLFELAKKDHDQAVALGPNDAELYFHRGEAYYDRGTLELTENKHGEWLDAAAADFAKATERDPKNALAYDRLGLTYEATGEWDKAIQAYTREWALNSLGKSRLADVYCTIGFRHQQQKEFAAAAAAYQKSTGFGPADDKTCPYEPFSAMAAIYTTETREYDKAWEVVHQAQKAGRPVASELIRQLKDASGRGN
ncbi:MAG: tetratricopeptide repeat protein [Bryobacteraceae bacterium]